MEGVMHTALGTQIGCAQRFGSGDLTPTAPALSAAAGGLAAATALSDGGGDAAQQPAGDDAVASKAACLATPIEPVDDSARAAARAAFARLRNPEGPAAPARPVPVPAEAAEAEDGFCHVELWQRRVALLECAELAAEHLRKSGPVRRRRRLALVRAVRDARGLLSAVRLPFGAPQGGDERGSP